MNARKQNVTAQNFSHTLIRMYQPPTATLPTRRADPVATAQQAASAPRHLRVV
eukprot:COSAG02_NODE_2111_length_9804_cov_5.586296_3_plen_53_part_00